MCVIIGGFRSFSSPFSGQSRRHGDAFRDGLKITSNHRSTLLPLDFKDSHSFKPTQTLK